MFRHCVLCLLSYLRLGRLISLPASEPVRLWLNLLGGAWVSIWAGPLKRSKKESGRSVSSCRLFCAHSLRVITIPTILRTGRQKNGKSLYYTAPIILKSKSIKSTCVSSVIIYQMSYLDRAPRPWKEFWELLISLLSIAAILWSSEEVSSHIDWALHR